MRIRIVSIALLFLVGIVSTNAQQAPAQQQLHGNLLQVMRGIIFPASNVIFTAQDDPTDPNIVPPALDPSTSPNPLNSAYGGWQAVENAGIAMAEAANLLTIPGRMCSSGREAPVGNADWQQFTVALREAGMMSYKAGQSRNIDQVLDAAGAVAAACGNCHDVYREKTPAQGGPANRCIAS